MSTISTISIAWVPAMSDRSTGATGYIVIESRKLRWHAIVSPAVAEATITEISPLESDLGFVYGPSLNPPVDEDDWYEARFTNASGWAIVEGGLVLSDEDWQALHKTIKDHLEVVLADCKYDAADAHRLGWQRHSKSVRPFDNA